MRKLYSLAITIALLLMSSTAAAAVCVQIDEERDNLKPSERLAVKTMVEDTLRKQGLTVAQTNCAKTYTVYSLRLGNSVTANISGPEGSRSQKAASLDELAETYQQVTRALVANEKGQMAGTTRHNVTERQAAPRRVQADNIYYLRLGYGVILGGDFAGGPAPGFGWRYELDEFGIDISALNFVIDDADADGFHFTLLRLGGLYFFEPVENSTPYMGSALSWGWTGVNQQRDGFDEFFVDGGLQGEVSAGYEFMRASSIRLFVEANAVLPFYRADLDGDDTDSTWTPTFGLSLGVGYDPDPDISVEVYD